MQIQNHAWVQLDEEAGTLYIDPTVTDDSLRPIISTDEPKAATVIFDRDKDGIVIGIEVLF